MHRNSAPGVSGTGGNAASSSPPAAALHRQNLAAFLEEKDDDGGPTSNFQRICALSYAHSPAINTSAGTFQRPTSSSSSMEISKCISGTTGTVISSIPSLGTFTSIASTPSTSSGRKDSVADVYHLDSDEGSGHAVAATQDLPILPCQYHFLDCEATFFTWETWDTHCRSHFHQRVPPFSEHLPQQLDCPVKHCSWKDSASIGQTVWEDRLAHLKASHDTGAEIDVLKRAPAELTAHLFHNRLVSIVEYKSLCVEKCLQGGSAYVMKGGPMQDKRRRREGRHRPR